MPAGVRVDHTVEVVWEGGQRFRGGRAGGATMLLDGSATAGPSPVDAMLLALASCSAIDVVEILEKRRTPPRGLRVSVEFSRAAEHPRRITDARLLFTVDTSSQRSHVERAIALSFEKYCSVSGTFAPDTEIAWELEMVTRP